MKCLILTAIIFIVPCSGQEILTAEAAVAQALAGHPLIKASEARIAARGGELRQAGMAPNPTFIFQHENIRSAPGNLSYWTWTDTFAYLEQRIETAGKRGRRKESAAAVVERAEYEAELTREMVAGNVKRAYWEAAGKQRVHELLLESAKTFLLTVRYHEVRVAEGAAAEGDLLRIRLESERLNLAAQTAYLEEERARVALFRAMGSERIPDQVQFEALEFSEGTMAPPDVQRALADRAAMKVARQTVEQARRQVLLSRSNAKPDVGLLAGYKRTAGYDSLLAGVKVDLPLFNRNQGSVAAASSRVEAARAELRSMAAVVRAEVALARRDWEIRRDQILKSLRPMREQARESAEIAQAAYREGGWDLLRLLDAERLRIEIELLYQEALAAYRGSVVELEIAMGVTQ